MPLQREIEHKVVTADFVALENTGMVHIAPGHGWDDYVLGTKEGLAIVCPVDGAGKFKAEAGEFAGQFVRDANENVLAALGDHLLAKETVTHRDGHCCAARRRSSFRATSQWFLKASEMRDLMLSEVEKVTWYPEWAGSARFYDWIKEARDWCISRQRYWGDPDPRLGLPEVRCLPCHRDHRGVQGAEGEAPAESPPPCTWTASPSPAPAAAR